MTLVRLTLLLLLVLAAYGVARRRAAALRHAILVAGLLASFLLPAIPSLRRAEFAVPEPVAAKFRTGFSPSLGTPGRAEGRSPFDPAAWLALGWVGGAAFCLLRIARSLAAARRLLRRGAIAGAATIGVLRPVIVIPERFRGTEREAALAHESAHVRRRDPLTQLLARLACAVWWFHPLAWVILRLILLEQEKACDDAVLGEGVDGAWYADLLLAAATERALGASMSSTRQLEKRLLAVCERRERGAMARGTAAMIALTIVTVTTAMAAVSVSLFDDPVSERLPEVRVVNTFAPAPEDAPLYQSLLQSAERPKTWRGDLVAERARWALSRAEAGRLLDPLRRALDDRDWRVRAYAAWSLAQAGDRGATPRLIALLDDPVWRMRSMAATALQAGGDPRALAAMRRAATDRAWQVRAPAAHYLAALHDPMEKQLAADPHPAVRAAVEEVSNR
jgi:beta-lactamase regulating signal transducer with metallopeptidase domain